METAIDVRIMLAASWIALMLTYLLGDVLRIFSGEFVPGEISGQKVSGRVWLGISIFMLIPIVMIMLSLMLGYPLNRWVNMIAAVILFVFNLIGLPTYPSAYDRFLIIVGLALNVLTFGYALGWA
jgi:hypothetical protein